MFGKFLDPKNDLAFKRIFGSAGFEGFFFFFSPTPQFTKTKNELTTTIDKWAYFFKHADETKEEDLDKIIGDALILKRAYEELNRFSWSIGDLRTYDSVDMKSEVTP